MGLFGNKNKYEAKRIIIVTQSETVNRFLEEVGRLVNRLDARVYASEQRAEDLHKQGKITNRGDFYYGTAKEMESFYAQLAELVKEQREANHKML
jgi:hypothetical protein